MTSEKAVPDWARISRSLSSAGEVRSSFSTKMRSTLWLKASASGRLRNRNSAAAPRMRTMAAMPRVTIRVPATRTSVAEEELSCTLSPLVEPRIIEERHDVQKLPAVAGNAPRDVVRNAPRVGTGSVADLDHPVMQPQGVVAFGLVVGIARRLRHGRQGEQETRKENRALVHVATMFEPAA